MSEKLEWVIERLSKLLKEARDRAAKLEAVNSEMHEACETLLRTLDRANLSNGICCCGDNMDAHHPMSSDHSPVDSGEHYGQLAIERARAIIEKSHGAADAHVAARKEQP